MSRPPSAWLVAVALFVGCAGSSTQPDRPARPLEPQLADAVAALLAAGRNRGLPARSRLAVFVPEETVHPRHRARFAAAVESAVREAVVSYGLQFTSSAEHVFSLSEQPPPEWPIPSAPGGLPVGADLAGEFQRGTRVGWTAIHTYWRQLNRLLVGDNDWIQSLPHSYRADLSVQLDYLVRVEVGPPMARDVATHEHSLVFSLVAVGSEDVLCVERSPLVLTYPLL